MFYLKVHVSLVYERLLATLSLDDLRRACAAHKSSVGALSMTPHSGGGRSRQEHSEKLEVAEEIGGGPRMEIATSAAISGTR